MYCKFKEGDLVMVTRDTKSYYGEDILKWTYGLVMMPLVSSSKYDGYVRVVGVDAPDDKFCGFSLIPIKDLKKISDKKIPKGSYRAPWFNNGDHVVYKGKTRFLDTKGNVANNKQYYNERNNDIEGWVVDNKPYYNECKIVIRTKSGKYILVDECDTRTIYEYRYFDTEVMPRHLFNSVYGMTNREFEYCVNDVAVAMSLKKYEQKLKEVSNMLNDGRIVQFKREGNTITATLYDSKDVGNGSKSHSPIVSASAKCHPDDRFDIDLGMNIAFKRLSAKWKLINKKSNLQRFLEGDVYVRVKKNDYCKFMCTLHDHDIWISYPVSFSISASINDTLTFGVFGGSVQFMPGSCSYVKNVIDFEELLK